MQFEIANIISIQYSRVLGQRTASCKVCISSMVVRSEARLRTRYGFARVLCRAPLGPSI